VRKCQLYFTVANRITLRYRHRSTHKVVYIHKHEKSHYNMRIRKFFRLRSSAFGRTLSCTVGRKVEATSESSRDLEPCSDKWIKYTSDVDSELPVASPGNEVRGDNMHYFVLPSPAWDFFLVPRLF